MQSAIKLAVSIFILFLIGVQSAASFGFLHRYRYWPFLSYPMYNRPHQKDEPVARYSLVGLAMDGREVAISPEDLGLDFWRYLRGPVRLAQREDAQGLLSQLEPWEHRTKTVLKAVRLENHPVVLVAGKVQPAPSEVKVVALRRS